MLSVDRIISPSVSVFLTWNIFLIKLLTPNNNEEPNADAHSSEIDPLYNDMIVWCKVIGSRPVPPLGIAKSINPINDNHQENSCSRIAVV